ncbi:hypothetical protein [Paenibacillus eucommiae]|uniref:Uncharacterized protein n=1 Tax=Paenibacillus eucommiae TaxID=1355755 RepID=A0ABS4J643_9BACL|nr:hypothetical protein [Paenibacillus eucommiae]MBP1995314.1 hypothetical protein [Paenibacillus eucommiae]
MQSKAITSKRMLEREAVRHFIGLYNQLTDNRLRLLYMHDKPDAVLQDSRGRKLGVEITHLFYDQMEARQLFQHQHRSFVCIESFDNLVQELNQLVVRKEAKSAGYSHQYPLALLIRNLSINFGWNDFNQAWDKVRKPSSAFTDIWFLARNHSQPDQWYLKSIRF